MHLSNPIGKAVFAFTLFASGCTTAVTVATSGTVVVRAGFPDMGPEKATALAEKECNKNGKAAELVSMTSPTTDRYIFKCTK